jgi:hypothetical protein
MLLILRELLHIAGLRHNVPRAQAVDLKRIPTRLSCSGGETAMKNRKGDLRVRPGHAQSASREEKRSPGFF